VDYIDDSLKAMHPVMYIYDDKRSSHQKLWKKSECMLATVHMYWNYFHQCAQQKYSVCMGSWFMNYWRKIPTVEHLYYRFIFWLHFNYLNLFLMYKKHAILNNEQFVVCLLFIVMAIETCTSCGHNNIMTKSLYSVCENIFCATKIIRML